MARNRTIPFGYMMHAFVNKKLSQFANKSVYISRTEWQPDGCRGLCPRTPEVYPLGDIR